MREISPALNATADECFEALPSALRALVMRIRKEKAEGSRAQPSTRLTGSSTLLTASKRSALLDKVAALVDENLGGRSDMCEQFASLLALALNHLGITARSASGEAIYFGANSEEIFRWRHVWVRVGVEVIDGNVDSLDENPAVPAAVRVAPYWGLIQDTPRDRRLRESNARIDADTDVIDIWWPDLMQWLDHEFSGL